MGRRMGVAGVGIGWSLGQGLDGGGVAREDVATQQRAKTGRRRFRARRQEQCRDSSLLWCWL